MLTVFNQIANLAAGVTAIASGVQAAAPQLSAQSAKQATLAIATASLQQAAAIAPNAYLSGTAEALLSPIYDSVLASMTFPASPAAAAPVAAKATAAGTVPA
jgi:hypothetical protein